MTEFFTDPVSGEAMYRRDGEPIRRLTETDRDVIDGLLGRSREFYPEQFEALSREYAGSAPNRQWYDFLMARRIVNCCFGENDRRPDIDEFGQVHFEAVRCPRVAECKYFRVICSPRYESRLSERELQVMEHYYNNVPTEEIAERLFISMHTVNNHRRNALQRLKLHSLQEFMRYATANSLFANKQEKGNWKR